MIRRSDIIAALAGAAFVVAAFAVMPDPAPAGDEPAHQTPRPLRG